MKKYIITGSVLVLILSNIMYGQGEKLQQKNWGLSLSGFLNAQLFFDTRQNIESRAGMFTLYPREPEYDTDGNDINSKANLNQAAMTTRLRATIDAPDVFNARSGGVIEVDFTGVNDLDHNGLRLREGWLQLKWTKTQLLAGLYWHPLYVPEVRPKTISLNLGAPYHPFSRHNQLRLQQRFGNFELIAVAASQIEFSNYGPIGKSSVYLRNSAIPNFDLQGQYYFQDHIFGAGIDYKQLLPRLSVELVPGMVSSANDRINSFAATVFTKLSFKKILIKFQAIWGQNLTEHIMLGGYIESKVDTLANHITYANTEQFSLWTDIITTGKRFRVGLFAGFGKNLGYNSPIAGSYYTRGNNIDYSYRISPRLQFHYHKLLLAGEFEYTVAAYGIPDINGKFSQSQTVGNFRVLLAVFYFF